MRVHCTNPPGEMSELVECLRPCFGRSGALWVQHSGGSVPDEELFAMCTVNPARHMGIEAWTLSVGKGGLSYSLPFCCSIVRVTFWPPRIEANSD